MAAKQQHARYQETWTREWDRASQALAASEAPWRQAAWEVAAAYERLQAAMARFAELPGRHRAGGGLLDRLGIGTAAPAGRGRASPAGMGRPRPRPAAVGGRTAAVDQRAAPARRQTPPPRPAADAARAGARILTAGQNRQRAAARWHEAARAASGEALPEPRLPATAAAALRAVLYRPRDRAATAGPASTRPIPPGA